jgi:hypothetical protein
VSNLRPIPDKLASAVLLGFKAIWPETAIDLQSGIVVRPCRKCRQPFSYQPSDGCIRLFCDACMIPKEPDHADKGIA